MKKLKSRFSSLLITSFMLFFLGCNGSSNSGSGNDGSTPGTEDPTPSTQTADFTLTLTSYARDSIANSLSNISSTDEESLRLVTGTILVVNQDKTVADGVKEYNWALKINESAIEIQEEVTLPLDKGAYDFYFLMSADGKQYAAITRSWLILEGNNAIPFLIHPVIGENIPNVSILENLAEFQFIYDNDVVSAFDDPAFGIIIGCDGCNIEGIDGVTEHIFSVNTKTGLSRTFIYLPAGTYTFGLNFYDGALLKSVLEGSQTTITITEGGGSIQLDIVPLIAENTYTYDSENSSGIFHLVVPNDVIEEAGSISNVLALFSLTGTENQPIQLTVPLVDSGSNYEGTVIVPNFTPGLITWALQIADTSSGENEVYAYCGQSIEITNTSQTLSCDFTMVRRSLPNTSPMGILTINVKTNDFPIAGAIVTANNKFIGITGNGENGSTLGQLQVFLPEDTYLIKAISGNRSQIVETTIALDQGELYNLALQLPRPAENNQPVAENITVQTGEGVAIAISLPGTDPDPWDVLTWRLGSGPTNGTVSFGNNTATYTPNVGFSRADSFTYIVSDDRNLDSDPATVSIQVGDVVNPPNNTAPTATNIEVSTDQNLPVKITLLGSDADEGDTLEYIIGEQPTGETVSVLGEVATFTPTENFIGTVVFNYTVSDGSLTSGPATVTITVNEIYIPPANNVPTAADIASSTDQNTLVEIILMGSDTDEGEVLSFNIETQPVNGSIVEINGNSVIYAPGDNFWGSDNFTYTASDGKSNSNLATVTITVNRVENPLPLEDLLLTASFEPKTKTRINGEVELETPIAVKIPYHEQLEILNGNPDRFTLLLRFGKTSCIYKGGSGIQFWKFKSPVCGFGKYSAGDTVIARNKITARILNADHSEDLTTIRVRIKQLDEDLTHCFFDKNCRRKTFRWKNIWSFFKH